MISEATPLTQAQIQTLYTRGIIDRVTWTNALRTFHGDHGHVGQKAIQACELAIETLVERAVDAACASIQERLGVKTGDLAAVILSDGAIERELTRYVHAELAMAGEASEAGETTSEAGETSNEAGEAAGEAGEAVGEAGEAP